MALKHAIQAILFDGKGQGKILPAEEINFTPAEEENSFLWIHIDYNTEEGKNLLVVRQIDRVVKNNLIDEDTRPRFFHLQEGLFLSLRAVNLNPGSDPDDMIGIRIWITPQLIISSNSRPLFSLQDIVELTGEGRGPTTPASFINLLIERLAVRAENVIEQLDVSFEELEDLLLDQHSYDLRSSLSELRRQAIRLRRYFAPQRETLQQLLAEPPEWYSKRDKVHLRENVNKFKRYLEELDYLVDRAIVAQEELNGSYSEMLNKRMYTLSLVATLFMPLGFLTGLLGINVGGIPWAENPYGFLFICITISALAGLISFFLHHKKWF